jgi:hypothetical protein
MNTLFCTLVLLTPAAPTDAPRLKARAALALAFAPSKRPSYSEQYARAVREGRPLVVWVGQPVRALGGCVGVGCATFPGTAHAAVVVGLPTAGGLRRVDLPGTPNDADVRAALKAIEAPPLLQSSR